MTRHPAAAFWITAVLLACDAQGQSPARGLASRSSALESAEAARVRRVWARAQDYSSPSPDGRFIAFVDWTTGDVAMHDIASGNDQRLTNKGSWTEDGSWAEEPLFSPDGRRVAYSYGNVLSKGGPFQYELRVVEVGKTTQRVLHALKVGERWIAPLDWSQSQGILVEINRGSDKDFATDLGVVNPETGSLRVLRTYAKDQPHPHDGAFSPDGRFVVYRQDKDARVRSVDGARDQSLEVEVRWVLGWAPDGASVLVHASRQSTTGVWSIPVSEGRRAGEPALIRGGMPALLPGGFARGAYYYVVPVDAPRVYTAAIDVAAGRVLSPPTPITSPVDGRALVPAWSPDGKSLAYALRDATERRARLMVRAADGDEVREVTAIPQEQVGRMLWTRDGQALLVAAQTVEGYTVFRVDIRSGEVTTVMGSGGFVMSMAPDDRLVYVGPVRGDPQSRSAIFIRDLKTGQERRIADAPGFVRSLSVSPDGRQIAMATRYDEERSRRVVLMPLEGAPIREVIRADYPAAIAMFAVWTPDGRHVLVGRGSWEKRGAELIAVPVAGGPPIRVMDFPEFPEQRAQPTLHPDGRRLAYIAGEPRMELWVLEDLTPANR